jgi:hypothetical protein
MWLGGEMREEGCTNGRGPEGFDVREKLVEGLKGERRRTERDVLCSESMRDSVEAAFESLRKRYHFVQFMDRSWKI